MVHVWQSAKDVRRAWRHGSHGMFLGEWPGSHNWIVCTNVPRAARIRLQCPDIRPYIWRLVGCPMVASASVRLRKGGLFGHSHGEHGQHGACQQRGRMAPDAAPQMARTGHAAHVRRRSVAPATHAGSQRMACMSRAPIFESRYVAMSGNRVRPPHLHLRIALVMRYMFQ